MASEKTTEKNEAVEQQAAAPKQPQQQQQTKKREVAKKPQTLVYAGPNLPGGILSQYTTFRGELPQHVVTLQEKYEGFDKLFVEPSGLRAFEQKAMQAGTSQHRAYQNALKGGK